MNSKHDDDKLNFTIHQRLPSSLLVETVNPLTVRAIIDHLTKLQRAASALSDAERKFLADCTAAEDHGAFIIEDEFLPAAINDGKALREESYSLGDEKGDGGGWFGIHRFLGLYVVNSTQYGEGTDLFGPFANRKDADKIFNAVVFLYTPPT